MLKVLVTCMIKPGHPLRRTVSHVKFSELSKATAADGLTVGERQRAISVGVGAVTERTDADAL